MNVRTSSWTSEHEYDGDFRAVEHYAIRQFGNRLGLVGRSGGWGVGIMVALEVVWDG